MAKLNQMICGTRVGRSNALTELSCKHNEARLHFKLIPHTPTFDFFLCLLLFCMSDRFFKKQISSTMREEVCQASAVLFD